MSVKPIVLLATSSVLALAGCVNLAPDYERPAMLADVPALPEAETLSWSETIQSPELASLIELALAQNSDLAAAAARVQLAQAQYGIALSGKLPTVTATASATTSDSFGDSSAAYRDSTIVQTGVSAFELDFFSRIDNLGEAALNDYLASREGANAARITIAATVAELWIRLAADSELLRLAEQTVEAQNQSLQITQGLFDAGVATDLDRRRASASVNTAEAQAAQYRAQIKQDLNALRYVVGGPLPQEAAGTAALMPAPVAVELVPGLSSEILLSRPDVMAAEYSLQAANADIGAARAALFPRISLTGTVSAISSDLSDLTGAGSSGYTVGPAISLPIFNRGTLRGGVEVSEAARDLALAQYQSAVRAALQDAADGLAVAETIDDRLAALESLAQDTSVTLELSSERFRVGVDDYLSVLDAQRADYSSRQQVILAQRDRLLNRVSLLKAFGAVPE